MGTERPQFVFGPFQLDREERSLLRDGQAVALTPKVFDALVFLVDRPGQLVTKDALMAALWPDTNVTESNLTQTIFMLRKALGESAAEQRYIVTVSGRGYRFVLPPEEATPKGRSSGRPFAFAGVKRAVVVLATGVLMLVALAGFRSISRQPQPRVSGIAQAPITDQADGWEPLLTDGTYVYFLQRAGDHWELSRTLTSGGEVQRMATPFKNTKVFDISPTGEFIITGFEKRTDLVPLWTWRPDGGAPQRLGQISALDATWSPDGNDIVYAVGNEIHRVHRDGSGDHALLEVPGSAAWIRWSRDRRRMRFTVSDETSERSSIWEAAADGSGAHALFGSALGEPPASCGDWTSNGRYFIYTVHQKRIANLWATLEQRPWWKWSANPKVQLTSGVTSIYCSMPSRDANQVFSLVDGNDFAWLRYNIKTQRFTPMFPGKQLLSISYSQDRRHAIYSQHPDWSLWRSNGDGTQAKRIATGPFSPSRPQLSPDGQWIVFEAGHHVKTMRAYVMDAEGGAVQELLPQQPGEQSLPFWSPDGASVAIGLNALIPDAPAEQRGIFVVDWKTRSATKIEGSEGLTAPMWSPDGKHFLARTTDDRSILFFDPQTKKWNEVASGTKLAGPIWSPDSRFLYFQDMVERGQAVYRVQVSTGRRERVADFASLLAGGVSRCVLHGIDPDGSLVISTLRSGTRIYAMNLDLP